MFTEITRKLRERKRELGISEKRIAEIAGLSRTAVRQVFNDPSRSTAANLFRIAALLGLEICVAEEKTSYQIRRNAALKKARKIMELVQGNSALELQAVDDQRFNDMVAQTADEIMAGPRSKLWN